MIYVICNYGIVRFVSADFEKAQRKFWETVKEDLSFKRVAKAHQLTSQIFCIKIGFSAPVNGDEATHAFFKMAEDILDCTIALTEAELAALNADFEALQERA